MEKELYKEILIQLIKEENITCMMAELVEKRCYKALKAIKAIVEDGSLSDFECVEEIVCIFEEIGSSGGIRHDF